MTEDQELKKVFQSWPQSGIFIVPTGMVEWSIWTQEEYKSDGIELECNFDLSPIEWDNPLDDTGKVYSVSQDLENETGDWLNEAKVRLWLSKEKTKQDKNLQLGGMYFEEGRNAPSNEGVVKIFVRLSEDDFEKIVANVRHNTLPSKIELETRGLASAPRPGLKIWDMKKYPKPYVTSMIFHYRKQIEKSN